MFLIFHMFPMFYMFPIFHMFLELISDEHSESMANLVLRNEVYPRQCLLQRNVQCHTQRVAQDPCRSRCPMCRSRGRRPLKRYSGRNHIGDIGIDQHFEDCIGQAVVHVFVQLIVQYQFGSTLLVLPFFDVKSVPVH